MRREHPAAAAASALAGCASRRAGIGTPDAAHFHQPNSLLPAGVPLAGAPGAPGRGGGGLGAGGRLGIGRQLRRHIAAGRQAREVGPRRRAHKLQAPGLALVAALLLALLLKLGRQPGAAAALSAAQAMSAIGCTLPADCATDVAETVHACYQPPRLTLPTALRAARWTSSSSAPTNSPSCLPPCPHVGQHAGCESRYQSLLPSVDL